MEATPKAVWITSPSAERCDPIALIKRKLFLYIWYFRTSWEWPTMHGEVWSIITAHADHACACMCVNMEHIAMVTTLARGILRDGLISYVVLKPPAPFNYLWPYWEHVGRREADWSAGMTDRPVSAAMRPICHPTAVYNFFWKIYLQFLYNSY